MTIGDQRGHITSTTIESATTIQEQNETDQVEAIIKKTDVHLEVHHKAEMMAVVRHQDQVLEVTLGVRTQTVIETMDHHPIGSTHETKPVLRRMVVEEGDEQQVKLRDRDGEDRISGTSVLLRWRSSSPQAMTSFTLERPYRDQRLIEAFIIRGKAERRDCCQDLQEDGMSAKLLGINIDIPLHCIDSALSCFTRT